MIGVTLPVGAASSSPAWLLLDRVPFLPIRRDDLGENVLRLVVVARRLDAELAHEAYAVEVGVFGDARLLRRFADVRRLDAASAFEDGAEPARRDVGSLCVSVGRAAVIR